MKTKTDKYDFGESYEVRQALDGAMTVADLLNMLKGMDREAKVFFTCSYGDYHDTPQALPIRDWEERTASELKESAYSQSRVALAEADDSSETYCEKCDEYWGGNITCPKCGEVCVTEDGEPADETGDDSPIVVFS